MKAKSPGKQPYFAVRAPQQDAAPRTHQPRKFKGSAFGLGFRYAHPAVRSLRGCSSLTTLPPHLIAHRRATERRQQWQGCGCK
jgi:hypothetical protein